MEDSSATSSALSEDGEAGDEEEEAEAEEFLAYVATAWRDDKSSSHCPKCMTAYIAAQSMAFATLPLLAPHIADSALQGLFMAEREFVQAVCTADLRKLEGHLREEW